MAAAFAAWPDMANACPDCEVGRTARRLAFGESFASSFAAIALPFAVVVSVAFLAERLAARRAGHASDEHDASAKQRTP